MNLSRAYRKPTWGIVIALLLLVSWLGTRDLNTDSLWLDEYWSLYNAGGAHMGPLSPLEVWNRVAEKDPWQSPGYYMMLNLWGNAVGWSEFAARSLSLFLGLLAVAWTYRLGRDLISPYGGMAAVVALGVSAYFVYFLHEMRSYTLYVLFTPWMVWAYWRLMKRSGIGTYVLLFLALTGSLYTHYFAGLTGVVLGIVHLTAGFYALRKNRRLWWSISIVFLLSAVVFSPWLAVLIQGITTAISQIDVRGANALTSERMVTGMLYLFSNGATALLILILVFSARLKKGNLFVWFWFLSVLAIMIAVNARLGVILEIRYMFALWPALAILVGFSLDYLRSFQPFLPLVIMAVWIVGGVWVSSSPDAAVALSNPHWHLPWREFRQVVQERAQLGDAAIFTLPDWTWAVYHEDVKHYYLDDLPLKATLLEQPGHIGVEQYHQTEVNALQNKKRVWAASTPAQPLTHFDLFESILAENDFLHCARLMDTDLLHVDLYARASAVEDEHTLGFANPMDMKLTPFQPIPSVTPSGLLSMTYLWQIADPSQAQFYSIAFHLLDAEGNLVIQSDQGVPPESTACRLYELDTHTVPPGDYTLYVTIYRWETGDRLPLVAGDYTVATDGRIVLGNIHIERNT